MATEENSPQLGPFATAIAAAVRSVVAGKGMSGSELAKHLNRAQSYASYRLNGKKSWTLEEVDQIAEVLSIEIDDIFDLARKFYYR